MARRRRCRLASVALLLSVAALHAPARADDFDLTARDKLLHMSSSYALTLSVDLVATRLELPRWQAVLVGAAATALVGTTKELVLDDDYDWGDQLANGIGIAAATGFVLVLHW